MHGGGLPGALLMRGGGGEWGRCWERTPSKQAAARLPGNLRVCNRQHNFPCIFGSAEASWLFSRTRNCCRSRCTGWPRTGQVGSSALHLSQASSDWRSSLHFLLEMKPVESPRQENLSSSETVGFKSPRGIVWWRPSSILAKQL